MNLTVCPTVTAYSKEEYADQLTAIVEFAPRIHIDLMDGVFAPTTSQSISDTKWKSTTRVDLHVMFRDPMVIADEIIGLNPRLVIVHAEAEHASSFVHLMHENSIRTGIAILQDTDVDVVHHYANVIDHVLIFSGSLGHHGGVADFSLLDKVRAIKARYPQLEIGWDGGINDENIRELSEAGVSVFNVGGFIQKSENPKEHYEMLIHLLQS